MMATEVLSVDTLKLNAYGDNPLSFDVKDRVPVTSDMIVHDEGYDPDVSMKKKPSKVWELDVRPLISTRKWLMNYGLKRNRLDLFHILPQIGFKHAEDFDPSLKKPVSSRYGEGMFKRYFRQDGKVFNISCSKEKVKQIENRLVQAILLYKRRLQWLTSESRRLFGVIQEHCISIVLDIKNMSPQQFDQYRAAMERILKEQVSQCGKFNIIRAAEDMVMYSPDCVPVTSESIDNAIDWLWELDRLASVSRTATTEAVVKAMEDTNIECVYLFSEGCAAEGTRELLKEKLVGAKLPLHVISYNCSNPETMQLLRALAKITGGRFHAYAVVMEMDSYEGLPPDPLTHRANIVLKKKAYGGIPAGAGCREDVILLFEELEDARNTLQQVQALLTEIPDPKQICDNPPDRFSFDQSSSSGSSRPEQYMGSKEWLDRNGMSCKRLGFFDILSGVAFKHCDGVIDLKEAPTDEELQTDAVLKSKLVNAKYCNRFAHVRWKDGQVVHVQVTPEIHRQYETRMTVFLKKINSRIDWLQQGSRALFGTVIEDDIVFLIDTSSSMEPSIQFVKDKIYTLMQEQLRHKQKFNIVSFNSRVCPWRDRLVEVTEENLQAAWQWVKNLSCSGSTNTMGALRFALADRGTQAIYLLTDGRPDQPPKTVLAQVNLKNHIPIHAISFNCADAEANKFLCQLAKDTTGRYHYFSEHGCDPDGPDPWESEDIRLLKEESHLAESNLDKIAQLRDECTALAWKREVIKKCSRDHILSQRDRISAVPPLSTTELYRGDNERPRSATGIRSQPSPLAPQRPSTAIGYHSAPHAGHRQKLAPQRSMTTPRPINVRRSRKNPLSASHTRTSLLRTLSSAGKFEDAEWLLPETKELFERQWERQKKLNEEMEKKEKLQVKKKKKMTDPLVMSSRQWLKKYGLGAKKLTILDALAPTIIPHNPKYVPILDKYVLSKVFDEVLPVAHMSQDKKAVKLVNPKAVDLKGYEKRLSRAIAAIRKHLNDVVWNCLPESEQEEFDHMPDFQEHKQQIFAALDRAGWPIKESDIMLLEDEIKQGMKYLEQSRALRSANPDLQAGDVGENISLSDSGDELEKVDEAKEEDADDEKDVDESDKKSVGSAHESELASPSPAPEAEKSPSPAPEPVKENSSRFEFEGLGEVMEKKTPRSSLKSESCPVSHSKVRKVLDTLKGQVVIARNTEDGLYYPGSVVKCTNSRHALVKFTEIGQKTVPTRFVIPTGGAVARPVLRVGDYVLLRVMNYETKYDCYVPGIIRNTPSKETEQIKFYTVMIYSGQKASALRNHLVKISKARFTFAVRYLKETQEQETPNIEITPRQSDTDDDDTAYKAKRNADREVAKITNGDHNGDLNGDTNGASETPTDINKEELLKSQEKRLDDLQHQLELQQRDQARQQRILRKETKRIARAQEKMAREQSKQQKQTEERLLLEQQKMMKKQDELIDKYEQTKSLIESSKRGSTMLDYDERVHTWIADAPGDATLSPGRTDSDSTRRKDLNSWDPNNTSGFLQKIRAKLHKLHVGEEVLARWLDEGWYYRGTVRQAGDAGAYFIEDSCGDIEKIWREDIITDEDDADNIIQIKDAVIALHPSFAYSYCPGVVMKVFPDLWLLIRFYDGQEARLPREEVYRITPDKFEYDVAFILQREDQWVGQAVVARDDTTGLYHLASVTERVGNGRQYVISWADGNLSVQTSAAIFGAFTKRRPLAIGDHVLAIADPVRLAYLPGTIRDISNKQLIVKFCDGSKRKDIDATQVFWLSQDYYEHAVAYYYSKNADSPRQSRSTIVSSAE
ncbi:von Willebrand factor A domain-containing protein 3B-like isoform X2 [Lineus longissimus]|uniref:von Willebrand factor A domain-containing protein 3B-like isoform X2 n=1 Tax=Lineus longissimus TaxID=88925 RepID=UPI00315DE861